MNRLDGEERLKAVVDGRNDASYRIYYERRGGQARCMNKECGLILGEPRHDELGINTSQGLCPNCGCLVRVVGSTPAGTTIGVLQIGWFRAVAQAVKSPKDRYNKRMARHIVASRLLKSLESGEMATAALEAGELLLTP